MKSGVDQGACIVYWRLSYRRKFIRTLWFTAVVLPILFALQVDGFVIGLLLVVAVGQACYVYYRWQREMANLGDSAVVSAQQQLRAQSDKEADRTIVEPKMSLPRKWPWLVGAFAICFVSGGAIWWRGSYLEYLESGFPWGTLLLLAGVALLLSLVSGAGIVASAITIGSAFPAIIFVRVVLDGMEDPTNHNLWPFEIVMTFGIGLIVTFPFAAFGALLRRVTHVSRV